MRLLILSLGHTQISRCFQDTTVAVRHYRCDQTLMDHCKSIDSKRAGHGSGHKQHTRMDNRSSQGVALSLRRNLHAWRVAGAQNAFRARSGTCPPASSSKSQDHLALLCATYGDMKLLTSLLVNQANRIQQHGKIKAFCSQSSRRLRRSKSINFTTHCHRTHVCCSSKVLAWLELLAMMMMPILIKTC